MTEMPMIPDDISVVLAQLTPDAPMSRAELCDKTGLSKSQIEDVLNKLTADNTVQAVEGQETTYTISKAGA